MSAVNFLLHLIGTKLKPKELKGLGSALTQVLFQSFRGHWMPEKPFFACGYRTIRISEDFFDWRIENACRVADVSVKSVKKALPSRLLLRIDPYEVTFVLGNSTHICTLYTFEGDTDNVPWEAPPIPPAPVSKWCCWK